jgi:hypothetical protein
MLRKSTAPNKTIPPNRKYKQNRLKNGGDFGKCEQFVKVGNMKGVAIILSGLRWCLFEQVSLQSIQHPTQRAAEPRTSSGAIVVGVTAFSGSLCGLKLVRQSGVVSSRPPAGNASRSA